MEPMSAAAPTNWLVPTVADRLTLAREKAGLEQGELAAMIGVSRNSVVNYESNSYEHRRKATVLERWAFACGFNPKSIDPTLNGPDDGPDDPAGQGDATILCFSGGELAEAGDSEPRARHLVAA